MSVPPSYKNLLSNYLYFEYFLPNDFLNAGPVFLKSINGTYDQINLSAISFGFSNGLTDIQTDVFGGDDGHNDTVTNLLYIEN